MKLLKNIQRHHVITGRRYFNGDRKLWLENIYGIYEEMRAATNRANYEAYCHLPLFVFPNVYAPNFFTDSFWFSKHLPKIIRKDSSILEIGTGTGIIAIMLALDGARKIVATDIVPVAVDNARANIDRHKLRDIISVREGHVYSPLKPHEKFDYIFWAHPFNNSPSPVLDPLLCTGLDYNYNNLAEYIENATKHLKKGGRLLLGTGDSADIETMWNIAIENDYEMKLLKKEVVPLEYGCPMVIELRIYEFI